MKPNLFSFLAIPLLTLTACGGAETGTSTATPTTPVSLDAIASQQNIDSGAEGVTFTGQQVVYTSRFSTQGTVLFANSKPSLTANGFSATVDKAETSGTASGAGGPAMGDGRGTVTIAGLASDIPISTFSDDGDFETRVDGAADSSATFIEAGKNQTVYIDIRTGSNDNRYSSVYDWTIAKFNTNDDLKETVSGQGVIGLKALVGNLPTGNANYTGQSYLAIYSQGGDEPLTGTFPTNFSIDFATSKFTGSNSQVTYAGTVNGVDITGTASAIAEPPISGVQIGDVGPLIGTVYGPAGQELGGVFQIESATGALLGTFIGKI